MIGVVAHERRHVERRRKPRLAMLEKILEPLVRVARGPEAGEHPHRPDPAAVHVRVRAAREGICARFAEVARRLEAVEILRGIDRLVAGNNRAREAGAAVGVAAHLRTSSPRCGAAAYWDRRPWRTRLTASSILYSAPFASQRFFWIRNSAIRLMRSSRVARRRSSNAPLARRAATNASLAAISSGTPFPLLASVRRIGISRRERRPSSNPVRRSCSRRSAPVRSALLMTTMSAISRTP